MPVCGGAPAEPCAPVWGYCMLLPCWMPCWPGPWQEQQWQQQQQLQRPRTSEAAVQTEYPVPAAKEADARNGHNALTNFTKVSGNAVASVEVASSKPSPGPTAATVPESTTKEVGDSVSAVVGPKVPENLIENPIVMKVYQEAETADESETLLRAMSDRMVQGVRSVRAQRELNKPKIEAKSDVGNSCFKAKIHGDDANGTLNASEQNTITGRKGRPMQASVNRMAREAESFRAEDDSKNQKIGARSLENYCFMMRGDPQFEAAIDTDASSVLNASAKGKSTGKSKQITIANGRGQPPQAELDSVVHQARVFGAEDELNKQRIKAKRGLEYFCLMTSFILREENFPGEIEGGDKEKIEEAVQSARGWLDKNPLAEKDDFEAKQKELEGILDLSLMKARL